MARIQDHCLALLILFLLVQAANALRCGSWICYGAGAYCCGSGCCYEIWSLWWFWMIWVFLFALLLSCGFWCRRRRRNSRQVDYLVVRGPRDTYYNRGTPNGPPVYNGVPVYGTVGTTESGTPVVYGVYPPAGPIPNAPGQSMMPPAYSPQTKPPDYGQPQPHQ